MPDHFQDHPRVCGQDATKIIRDKYCEGSPPRVRARHLIDPVVPAFTIQATSKSIHFDRRDTYTLIHRPSSLGEKDATQFVSYPLIDLELLRTSPCCSLLFCLPDDNFRVSFRAQGMLAIKAYFHNTKYGQPTSTERFQASGLIQNAWCREQGLSAPQLRYWLRKFQDAVEGTMVHKQWIPIEIGTVGEPKIPVHIGIW